MVVALLALFTALGGTSIAAVQLARDSVGTEQVKNNSITGADIRNGGVRSSDIKDGTITHNDVAQGTLLGSNVATNTINSRVLADNSIDSTDLGAGIVGPRALAPNAVTGDKVTDGSIGASDLAPGVGSGAGSPSGPAGGVLDGTYPNPKLAIGGIDSSNVFSASMKDGAAGAPTLRSLGTGSGQAAAGNDARLSDARTPTGAGGGDLSGTYPNPTLAAGSVSGGTGGDIVDDSVTGADVNELTLDTAVIQRRINGSCGGGQAIQSVNANGTVGCSSFVPASKLFSTGRVSLSPTSSTTLFATTSASVTAKCNAGPTAVITFTSIPAGAFLDYETRTSSGVVGATVSNGAPADVASTTTNDMFAFGILTNSFEQLDGQVAMSVGGGSCLFFGTARTN
jgi:hypothetical protein